MSDQLTELLNSLNTQAQQSKVQTTSSVETTDKGAGIYEDVSKQILTSIPAASAAAASIEAARAIEQSNAHAILESLGARGAGEMLSGMSELAKNSYARSQEALTEVYRKKSINFFENPIDWIAAKFTIGRDVANYEYNAHSHNNAVQAMQETVQLADITFKMGQATAAVHSATTVQAAADKATTELNTLQAQIAEKGLQLNITGYKQMLEQTDRQGKIELEKYNAWWKDENLNRMMAREDRLEAKELKEDAETAATINIARTYWGKSSITPIQIKTLTKLGGEARDELLEDYRTGLSLQSSGIVSINPGKAAYRLVISGAKLDENRLPLADLMVSSLERSKLLVPNPKDKNEVLGAAGKLILQETDKQRVNIKVADKSNIFSLPSLPSLVKVQEVNTLTTYDLLIKPALDAGMQDVNPEMLLSVGEKLIVDGKAKIETVAHDLAVLVRTGIRMNNATRRYMEVGIKPQTDYNTTVKPFPGMLRGSKINFADESDITKLLLQGLAIRKFHELNKVVPE